MYIHTLCICMMDVSSCFGSSSLLASSKCLSRSFCVFLRYAECKDFCMHYCCIDLYKIWTLPFLWKAQITVCTL